MDQVFVNAACLTAVFVAAFIAGRWSSRETVLALEGSEQYERQVQALANHLVKVLKGSYGAWVTIILESGQRQPDGSVLIPGPLVADLSRVGTAPFSELPEKLQAALVHQSVTVLQPIRRGVWGRA